MKENPNRLPFGIPSSRSFVVLDKSFLDGVTSVQLQCYAYNGWSFGITEVLMHEHLRKRDARRVANLFKLHSIEDRLFLLPGMGQMFQAESRTRQAAPRVLRAKSIKFVVERGPSGVFFELDGNGVMSTKARTAEAEKRLRALTEVWRMFGMIPALKNSTPAEMPDRVHELSLQIRDDHEDMRKFHGNHRPASYPAPELLDENWSLFRSIQVQLLAGLDFLCELRPR
jgi:hypothetical protein